MIKFLRDRWLEIALVLTCALIGVIAIGATVYEANHPCLRYETHHSDLTVVGYDHKFRPIYGPGEVRECVERAQ